PPSSSARRDGYPNAVNLLDLRINGLEAGSVAEPGHHVEEEVAARWVVPHRRELPQQIVARRRSPRLRLIGTGASSCLENRLVPEFLRCKEPRSNTRIWPRGHGRSDSEERA